MFVQARVRGGLGVLWLMIMLDVVGVVELAVTYFFMFFFAIGFRF
jgi:hypothetical protein